MAVIWRNKDGMKTYVASTNKPPSLEDIELAEKYDTELRKKMEDLFQTLEKNNFSKEKNALKKWHMLGRGLHFLDDMELRKKCDPELRNTWRVLFDLAPYLAPSKHIPSNEERAVGNRNHFYICYLLGKFEWERVKNLTWSHWNDIHMSFSPDMWKDGERLIEWVAFKSTENGSISRKTLRSTLKALRSAVGERAKIPMDTTVLSKEELCKFLDQWLAKQTL